MWNKAGRTHSVALAVLDCKNNPGIVCIGRIKNTGIVCQELVWAGNDFGHGACPQQKMVYRQVWPKNLSYFGSPVKCAFPRSPLKRIWRGHVLKPVTEFAGAALIT